ncbi:MAG TPA: peptidylprolyl isomerase [Chthoniobacteraceae bacterium]|nr:peptidylprolyl isomerase [Chthoniobacteraceae bacterium]
MSQKVISFHYTLTDVDGVTLESSHNGGEPITFLTGFGMIVPGLEKAIVNFTVGEKQRVEVKAEEAYGLIDFTKYVQVPREALQKPDIKEGDVFRSNQSPTPFTVKQVHEEYVILDGNHPLAGEDLIFDVEVTDHRDATEEEIGELKEQIAQMAKGTAPQEPAPEKGEEPMPPTPQA